jgi:hypothetical protein
MGPNKPIDTVFKQVPLSSAPGHIEEEQQLVTIPKEVADAIETLKQDAPDAGIIGFTSCPFIYEEYRSLYPTLSGYFGQHPHEYIRAIQEGYQVEKTPKEQILELRDMYSENIANYKGGNLANLSEWKVSKSILNQVIEIMGWEEYTMGNGFPSRCYSCEHYGKRIVEHPCNTCKWLLEGKEDNWEPREEMKNMQNNFPFASVQEVLRKYFEGK